EGKVTCVVLALLIEPVAIFQNARVVAAPVVGSRRLHEVGDVLREIWRSLVEVAEREHGAELDTSVSTGLQTAQGLRRADVTGNLGLLVPLGMPAVRSGAFGDELTGQLHEWWRTGNCFVAFRHGQNCREREQFVTRSSF